MDLTKIFTITKLAERTKSTFYHRRLHAQKMKQKRVSFIAEITIVLKLLGPTPARIMDSGSSIALLNSGSNSSKSFTIPSSNMSTVT